MRDLLSVDIGNLNEELVNTAAKLSDQELDRVYGYGLSTDPESFGYQANKLSAAYGLHEFLYGGLDDINDVESIASAVHDGWSFAAYHVDDPRYLTQPQKKVNRIALADIAYDDLSEDEKEKDRVIAREIIKFLKSYHTMYHLKI